MAQTTKPALYSTDYFLNLLHEPVPLVPAARTRRTDPAEVERAAAAYLKIMHEPPTEA